MGASLGTALERLPVYCGRRNPRASSNHARLPASGALQALEAPVATSSTATLHIVPFVTEAKRAELPRVPVPSDDSLAIDLELEISDSTAPQTAQITNAEAVDASDVQPSPPRTRRRSPALYQLICLAFIDDGTGHARGGPHNA